MFALEGVCAPALEHVPGTAPDLDSVARSAVLGADAVRMGVVLGAEAVLVGVVPSVVLSVVPGVVPGVVPSVVSAAVTRPAKPPDDGATLLAEVPGTTLCAEGAAASARGECATCPGVVGCCRADGAGGGGGGGGGGRRCASERHSEGSSSSGCPISPSAGVEATEMSTFGCFFHPSPLAR